MPDINNPIPAKFRNLLRNYGYMMGSYILFFMALGTFQVFYPEFDLEQYQQTEINRILQENPFQFFLLAVVLAPVIEEGMFRTLIKPSRNEFIFFLSIWILVLVMGFVAPLEIFWAIKYGSLLLLLVFTFFLLKALIPDSWQMKLSKFLTEHYLVLWILTALVFGMVHIFNYVEGFQLDFVLFLLIIPRIISGFFFGKIKIENRSLIWPITLHAMNNATVLLLIYPSLV